MSKNTVDDLVCREERKDYYNVEDLTCKEERKDYYNIEDLTFKCEALQMYCEHCQEIVNKDDWYVEKSGQLLHKCGNPITIRRGEEVEGTFDEKIGYTYNAQCALNNQALYQTMKDDFSSELFKNMIYDEFFSNDDNTTDNYITEYLEFGLNNYEQEYQDWILHIDNVDSSRYDFLLVKKWNFCCCGCPKDAVLAVKEMLDWCGEDIESRKSPSEFTNYQKFMLYFLDNKGYTEHGGSVNGSWLTNDGKDILQFINYALEQDEKDEL